MPVRVYFLLYESSVEEQVDSFFLPCTDLHGNVLSLECSQKYLTSLRKEKEAFQQLIKDRAVSVM